MTSLAAAFAPPAPPNAFPFSATGLAPRTAWRVPPAPLGVVTPPEQPLKPAPGAAAPEARSNAEQPVRADGDDAGLIAGLLAGERRAWRAFELRYARLIASCISRVTSRFACVRHDDVREIQATLYLELLSHDMKKLRSFEPGRGTRFGTWLGLLATHTAYDFLRRARRDARCEGLDSADSLRADTPDPSEYTLVRERAALVSEVLAALSPKEREFVELYYAEGLAAEEVARRMRISVKTVYTKKHKLRGRLEALLVTRQQAA